MPNINLKITNRKTPEQTKQLHVFQSKGQDHNP